MSNTGVDPLQVQQDPYSYQQYGQPTAYSYSQPQAANLQYGGSIIPQLNGQYSGATTSNPYQPSYVQTPTGVASSLGQNTNPAILGMFSPQSAEQQLLAAFQPQAAQSTRALNDTLAAMGLVGGPAVNAQLQLQQQLGQSLGGQLAGVIQNAQGNQLSALGTNASLAQQTGMQNLQNQFGANQYNTTAANDATNATVAAQQAAYQNLLSQFNALNSAGYNTGTGLASSALTGQQSYANGISGNFPVYSGTGNAFSNLGSSIGYGNTSGNGQSLASAFGGLSLSPSQLAAVEAG